MSLLFLPAVLLILLICARTGQLETKCWRSGRRRSRRSTRATGTCSFVKDEEAGCAFRDVASSLSSRMQAAEAELLYIKEVEKLDGFGQETFPAKVGG